MVTTQPPVEISILPGLRSGAQVRAWLLRLADDLTHDGQLLLSYQLREDLHDLTDGQVWQRYPSPPAGSDAQPLPTSLPDRPDPEAHVDLAPVGPAEADLTCWMWAAFATTSGRVGTRVAAATLGVSPSTIRRWLRSPHDWVLDPEGMELIRARAEEQAGENGYFWPPPDATTRARAAALLEDAHRSHELLITHPERAPSDWRTNGAADPHFVHLVYYHRARVFGVASNRVGTTTTRLQRVGTILQSVPVPNRYAARITKQRALQRMSEHQCIPPRKLLTQGRTETWRQAGGPLDLTEIAVATRITPPPATAALTADQTRAALTTQGCTPTCTDHPEHVYILCLGQAIHLTGRTRYPGESDTDYPVTHYVGHTTATPPSRRIRNHGHHATGRVAAIRPGTLTDARTATELETCPHCDHTLWYPGQAPTQTRTLQVGDVVTLGQSRQRYAITGAGARGALHLQPLDDAGTPTGPPRTAPRDTARLHHRDPGSYLALHEARQTALQAAQRVPSVDRLDQAAQALQRALEALPGRAVV